MLTFSLLFKSVSVIGNMWRGFDNIVRFNNCISDLIPVALAYTVLNLFWGNFLVSFFFFFFFASSYCFTATSD